MPNKLPKEEPKLPKPELDLPKPELDLPLPEQEIPAVATKPSRPFRFPLKLFALLLLAVLFFISGSVLLQNNADKSSVNPSPTPVNETASWKTYTDTNYSFRYPSEYFINNTPNGFSLALNSKDQSGKPVEVDKIIFTTNPNEFVNYKNSKFCSDPSSQPTPNCISDDGTYGQKETIENISLDGKTGVSFYMGRGTNNYGYHIIQTTNPSLELRANIQDKNFDNIFKKIISTFKFTDETANWKTYENGLFSIKYPPGFKIKSAGSDSVLLVSKRDNYHELDLKLHFSPVDSAMTRQAWFENQYGITDPKVSEGIKKFEAETLLDDYPAILYAPLSAPSSFYGGIFTVRNNYGFAIKIEGYNEIAGKEELLKIISTFKFKTPYETENLKTYTDPKYGFSFKYPARGIVINNKGENESGFCGNAIKELQELPGGQKVPDDSYDLLFDNFFYIRVLPWSGTISDYIAKQNATGLYNTKPIDNSGAEEALDIISLKPDAKTEGYPPLAYITNIYRYHGNLYIPMGLQNDGNSGGCVPFDPDTVHAVAASLNFTQ